MYYFDGDYPSVPWFAKLANPLGLSRIISAISPGIFISSNSANEYSENNLLLQTRLSSKTGFNFTIINETNEMKTKDISFDSNLPLLFFIRHDSSDKKSTGEKNRYSFYETYITNPNLQHIVELDSGHYMHWTQSERIAKNTNDFLKNVINLH